MRILLSAFAFSPKWGSEPGVGWCWAVEMAKAHDVTVLTHAHFRTHMAELEAAMGPLPFKMVYFDVEPIFNKSYESYLNSQLYFLRWQWHVRGFVKQMLQQERFDLIHHLTLGTVRYPSFLQKLGVPLVAGPLGGGERAPIGLYAGVPAGARLKEMLRDAVIWSTAWDPMIHWTWGRTEVLLCRTRESRDALPGHAARRAELVQEIGCPPVDPNVLSRFETVSDASPLRILHVGRLLAWKGLHLALPALARLHHQGMGWTLTVVGVGPMEGPLKAKARALGIDHLIRWTGPLPREEVMAHYGRHDLFLFPSLHDSGGTVVLESLSQGCPVVCTDLGGPAHFVDDHCGRVVPATSGHAIEVINDLGNVLAALAKDRPGLLALRQGAINKAQELSWPNRVRGAYDLIERALPGLRTRS